MANETFPLGRNAKVYYNTADKLIGDSGVETSTLWLADAATVEAGSVRNVTLNTASNYADTNTRASTAGGFGSQTPVIKSAEVTFDCIWDLGDAYLTKLMSAWTGDATLGLAFVNRDKDTLGIGDILNGLAGNFFVAMTKDEATDDVQRGNFTLTHADSGVWHEETGT